MDGRADHLFGNLNSLFEAHSMTDTPVYLASDGCLLCLLKPVCLKWVFLFNDTLNTFYLRLYGVRHMVKDHSDSEKGNPLPPLLDKRIISIRMILH